MRKGLLILPLVALLAGCATRGGAKVVPASVDWTASVVPLWDAEGVAYCTAYSVAPHVWLTVAHCAPDGQGETLGPLHAPVWTVTADADEDVAVLRSLASAPAISLGPLPSLGDMLSTAGYGHRGELPTLVRRSGRLLFYGLIADDDRASSIVDVPAVPGDSGSPVVDSAGRLVGMLWGFSEKNTLSWCVRHDVLKDTLDAIHASSR